MNDHSHHDEPFRPTADLQTLRQRSRLLSFTREFFTAEGYWEVETPLLSRDIVVDAHLEPFTVSTSDECSAEGEPFYLQTSPEFGMKRLLAAGAEAIFQITHAFRRGERGPLHNPEFTIVEWYRVGTDHLDQMDFTERLVKGVVQAGYKLRKEERSAPTSGDFARDLISRPFDRLSYDEAFTRHAGFSVLTCETSELRDIARQRKLVVPESLDADDRDGWLNLLLAELVEPQLGRERPVFVYDYPASQAALAQTRAIGGGSSVEVAERIELYWQGVELCNGYHELTDAEELARRNLRQNELRKADGRAELPADSFLLEAMRAGLPVSAGVALGFDRLVMLALGKRSLAEVMAFPVDRA